MSFKLNMDKKLAAHFDYGNYIKSSSFDDFRRETKKESLYERNCRLKMDEEIKRLDILTPDEISYISNQIQLKTVPKFQKKFSFEPAINNLSTFPSTIISRERRMNNAKRLILSKWLRENTKGMYIFKNAFTPFFRGEITLYSKEDAIKFKMTWCG